MGSMFIDIVPEEAAEGALAEFYQQQKGAWGFLPELRCGLLNTTGRRQGLEHAEQDRARRDGPPPLRDRDHRRCTGAALDVLHRCPLEVPARRV